MLEHIRGVGSDQTDNELDEACACLQHERTGEDIDRHRRVVGVLDRLIRLGCGDSLALTTALSEDGAHYAGVVEQRFERVIGEVDLELRAVAEDPAEVEVQRGLVDGVVGVVIVTDVVDVGHIVQPEHMGESVVRSLGAPHIDREFHARDVRRPDVHGGIVDHDRCADLKGELRLVAVLDREERIHVADHRAEDVAECLGAGSIGVVNAFVVLDILAVLDRVFCGIITGCFPEPECPLLFGEVLDILSKADGAADREIDGIQVARIEIVDVVGAVNIRYGRILAVGCLVFRNADEAVFGCDKVHLVVAELTRAAVNLDKVAVFVEVIGRLIAADIGTAFALVLVVVHIELGVRDERSGGVAVVIALACPDIFVVGADIFRAINLALFDADIGAEAFRRPCDMQIPAFGIGVEAVQEGLAVTLFISGTVITVEVVVGDELVTATVVEIIVCFGLQQTVGLTLDVRDAVHLLVLAAHGFAVCVFCCAGCGQIDAQGDGVIPQEDFRLDERLSRARRVDDIDVGVVVFNQHPVAVRGARVGHIHRIGAVEVVCNAVFLRIGFGTQQIRAACLTREDVTVVLLDVDVGLHGLDVVVAAIVTVEVVRGHVGTQSEVAFRGDEVHAVLVLGEAEAVVREIDLLRRCLTDPELRDFVVYHGLAIDQRDGRVDIVVRVDIDRQRRLFKVVELGFDSEQREQLRHEVDIEEHLDVCGGDPDAVDERGDVARDLAGEQRERIGDVDIAENGAEVDGQQRRGALRAVPAVRGDCLGCARGFGRIRAHSLAQECAELFELDEHAGLTEVSEVGVEARFVAYVSLTAARHEVVVGVQEGGILAVPGLALGVIAVGDGLVLASVEVVVTVSGGVEVGVDLLAVAVLRGCFHALAEVEVDAEHIVDGILVAAHADDDGRIDEVQEGFEADQVVRGVVVIDVAVLVGHFGADDSLNCVDECDEVDVALKVYELIAQVAVGEAVEGVERTQIVEEGTQLEFEADGEVDVAQDIAVVAENLEDGIDVIAAVGEEFREQARDVFADNRVVAEQQVERNRLGE